MKAFLKKMIWPTLMCLLVVGLIGSTTYTLNYQYVKIGGVGWLQWSTNNVKVALDTLKLPFTVNNWTHKYAPCDSFMVHVCVYAARVSAADSVNIKVRYQSSSDNVTWGNTTTLGTDGASWSAVASVYPIKTFTGVNIGWNEDGGWQPYMRLLVIGGTGCANTYLKIQVR